MKLGIDASTNDLQSTLQGWELNQLPFATSLALNRTAQKVKNAIRGTMQVRFDRPTPYTLNSLYLRPSTKTNLTAEVGLKNFASKAAPPSVYLAPQVFGGQRQAKRSELLMQRKGILPTGMLWVPGSGAKLDGFGNMSRSQVSQVLSALHGFGEVGFLANKSFRRGARQNKQTNDLFVGKPVGGRLPLGVYLRTKSGLQPIMIFIDHANYSVRLPFGEITTTVYNTNFQAEFTQALRDALILSPLLRAA